MKETCLTFCIKKIREYRKAGYPARIVCKFSPTVHCSVEVFLATSLLYLDWVHLDSYVGVKNRFLQFLLPIIYSKKSISASLLRKLVSAHKAVRN